MVSSVVVQDRSRQGVGGHADATVYVEGRARGVVVAARRRRGDRRGVSQFPRTIPPGVSPVSGASRSAATFVLSSFRRTWQQSGGRCELSSGAEAIEGIGALDES